MAKNRRQTRKKQPNHGRRQVKRIDILPDDVLLEIFDFYVNMRPRRAYIFKAKIEAWQSLVHVCRRWRDLVFGSPRRLNLRLVCTPKTPARDTLDVWLALPLIVQGNITYSGTDNVIAALERSNRICDVNLDLASFQVEEILAPMQVPFPELTDLELELTSYGEMLPVIPDSFLDGSAPRLRNFDLYGIRFPGLPKLLLSATHLVHLNLWNIPHSGYMSPEAMAAPLSMLSSLRRLILEFNSPQSRPDLESRSLPPPKRSILPALDEFYFKGVTKYLEDFVTRIDAPQLDEVDINFINEIDFDCPLLAQFINRTTLTARDKACVQFDDWGTSVALLARSKTFEIGISCKEPDLQLSSIVQVCNSSLHPLSTVETLYIEHQYSELVWEDDDIENTLWLQLLLPFTAVKNLYLSKESEPGIVAALQEPVKGRITEVLLNLQNIFVE